MKDTIWAQKPQRKVKLLVLSIFLFTFIFLLSSLRVSALNQDGSLHDLAGGIGRASGIIVAVLSQPYFMAVLILILIFFLVRNVIMIGLSNTGLGKNTGFGSNDDGRLEKISYIASAIVTIGFFFGGSASGSGVSPADFNSRVHSLMSMSSMMPFIFMLLIGALFFFSSMRNNPDMPAGKRWGGVLFFVGLAAWSSHGMVGSAWAFAGPILSFVGGFLYIFHASFNPNSRLLGNSDLLGNAAAGLGRMVQRGSPEEREARKRAKAASKASKKKAKKVIHIDELHKPELYMKNIARFQKYMKDEKEELKKDFDIVSKIYDKLQDLDGKVNSIDPQSDIGNLKNIFKEVRHELQDAEKKAKEEKKEKRREKKISRRAYRRGIKRIDRLLKEDHSKLKSAYDGFVQEWGQEGLREYGGADRIENMLSIQKNAMNTLGNMTHFFRSVEAARNNLPDIEKRLESISGTVDGFGGTISNYELLMQALTKEQDNVVRDEKRRQADNTKTERLSENIKHMSSAISSAKDDIDRFFSEFTKMKNTFDNMQNLVAAFERVNNNYANAYHSSEHVFNEVETRANQMSEASERAAQAVDRLNNALKTQRQSYLEIVSDFFTDSSMEGYRRKTQGLFSLAAEDLDGYSELASLVQQGDQGSSSSDVVQNAADTITSAKRHLETLQADLGVIIRTHDLICTNNLLEAFGNLLRRISEEEYTLEDIDGAGRHLAEINSKIIQHLHISDEEAKEKITSRVAEYSRFLDRKYGERAQSSATSQSRN